MPDYKPPEKNDFERIYQVKKRELIWDTIKDCFQLMKSCWKANPESRPPINNVQEGLQNYLSDAVEIFYSQSK